MHAGSAFCQMIDSIYGTVPLTRVKFETKSEYDYISNYKILQGVFNKHKIERNIPIDKLVKCRYADNLEFLQWMKKYWDTYYPGGEYNAQQRREMAMKPKPSTPTTKSPTSRSLTSPTQASQARASVQPTQGSKRAVQARETSTRPSSSKSQLAPSQVPPASSPRSKLSQKSNRLDTPTPQKPAMHIESPTPERVIQKVASKGNVLPNVSQDGNADHIQRQVAELQAAADTLERERNFYYLKLRDLEVLVLEKMENDDNTVWREIQSILYATEEGFIRPKITPAKLLLAPISVTLPRTAISSPLKTAPPKLTSNTYPVAYPLSASIGSEGRRASSSQSGLIDRRRSSLSHLVATNPSYASPSEQNEACLDNVNSSPTDTIAEAHSADTEIALSDMSSPSEMQSRPVSAAASTSTRRSPTAKMLENPPALPTATKYSGTDRIAVENVEI
ncbi:hypothetical protein HDU77_007651 [Chytriomyces hyalinus]|nr:hypothetical protein HDU77_007651 [Chytriomyces hyalinus]